MTTRIADVIVPEIFNPYVIKQTRELSALWQSGIVGAIPELDGQLTKGNVLVNMPFWNDLDGDSESLKDVAGWALTPAGITAGQDRATQLFRGRAWSATDLAATLSGDDPMGAIASLVAKYWTKEQQKHLVALIKGLFVSEGATLAETHVFDVSADAATPETVMTSQALIGGVSKLGDAFEELTAIAMHSVKYFDLVQADLIENVKDSEGKFLYNAYMGKRVIVDDGMPIIKEALKADKYVSVVFGQGAIGYAEGNPEVPTETDRDTLAGVDVLINRKHFLLHPRGVRFEDNVNEGPTPSLANLSLATNWKRVYDPKDVRMVAIITN